MYRKSTGGGGTRKIHFRSHSGTLERNVVLPTLKCKSSYELIVHRPQGSEAKRTARRVGRPRVYIQRANPKHKQQKRKRGEEGG